MLFKRCPCLVWLFSVSLLAGCASQQPISSHSSVRQGASVQTPASSYVVAQTVASVLDKHHLSPPASDVSLGKAMAESTLRRLDPDRQYLLRAEVDLVLSSSMNWPGKFRNGDIAEPLGLHKLVQMRTAERKSYELDVLNSEAALPSGSGQLPGRSLDWAIDGSELEARWHASLANNVTRTRALFVDEKQVRSAWIGSYTRLEELVQKPSPERLDAQAIDGLVQGYDKASRYTPNFSDDEAMGDLSLVGIGLVLKKQGADIEVVRAVPGGPADRAGIRPGERVMALGSAADQLLPVVGWPLSEVVRFMRGSSGTPIFLAISSSDNDVPSMRVDALMRSPVRLEDQRVASRVVSAVAAGRLHAVGLITVPYFYGDNQAELSRRPSEISTSADVERALIDLQDRGASTVVLDLRGTAGSLREAENLSALFLPPGQTVATLVGREGSSHQLVSVERKYQHSGLLMVLVDARTSGAAEIFVASLRDHGKAVLLGQRTFGLGTWQKPWDLQGAGLKGGGTVTFTTARSYRPTGQGIQQVGVIPDLLMPEQAHSVREGDEGNPLLPHDMAPVIQMNHGQLDSALVKLRLWHQRQPTSPRWKAEFAGDLSTARNNDDFWLEYAAAAAAEYARIVDGSAEGDFASEHMAMLYR
ncbi:MAG: S41 family peptidase [Pseudomonas sp.]